MESNLYIFIAVFLVLAIAAGFWFYFSRKKQSLGALSPGQGLQLMQTILDNALTSIFVKDKDHRYILINRHGHHLFHSFEKDILGKRDEDLFPPAYARHSQASEQMIFDTGNTLREESALDFPDGQRVFSIVKTPLRDSKGAIFGICVIATDITPQKNTQHKLNDYLEKLESVTTELMEARILAEQASRAKNAFLANISHELRTPLHTILGSVSLLIHTPLNDKQTTHVGRIEKSTQLLLEIIGNVLDLSKIDSKEFKLEFMPTDISQLVFDCYNLLLPKAEEKGLEFHIQLPDQSLPRVLCDPLRLKQVLINLINNAIKFTERGSVDCRLTIISASHETIQLSLEIADTGIGISKPQMERLFERFWQADLSMTRKYGGTGLGLAISKEIVDLMGGTVLVKSEEGVGSAFTVVVPFFVAHQNQIHKNLNK